MITNRSIKTLEIKNFQSHSHTVINFDEGINLVTGTSNAGKSAINRAIVWALANKPRGDYFIKNGAFYASVKITFQDDAQLLRVRGVDDNFVRIKHPDGRTEKYERFGNGEYPEEVKKFLSIPRENEALGVIFYAEQMSPLFLLNLSTADLPRAIGYLAGSDIMESAGSSMLSESRAIKRDQDGITKEIKQNDKELKNFSDLNEKFQLLKIVNDKLDQIKLKESLESKLNDYSAKFDSINLNIKRINDNIAILDNKIVFNNEISNIKADIHKYKSLKELLDIVNEKQNNIASVNLKLNKSFLFFKTYKQQDLKNLKNNILTYTQLLTMKQSYNKLSNDIDNINNNITNIEEKESKLKKEFIIMKQQLLDANFICKECGQKLK